MTYIIFQDIAAKKHSQEHSDSWQNNQIYRSIPKPPERVSEPVLDKADEGLEDDRGKTDNNPDYNTQHQQLVPLGKM